MGKYVTDLPSKNPERSVEKIEAYLANHAAFVDYLEAAEQS